MYQANKILIVWLIISGTAMLLSMGYGASKDNNCYNSHTEQCYSAWWARFGYPLIISSGFVIAGLIIIPLLADHNGRITSRNNGELK